MSWSSSSEIGDALNWLDSKDDEEAVDGIIALNSRRANAHGGVHSRPNSSTLQPLSNRNQKFSHHIRASPLDVSVSLLKVANCWLFTEHSYYAYIWLS